LREHLDGSLSVDDEGGVVSHLDACEGCRRALESLAIGGQRWLAVARQIGEEPPVASPVWDEVATGLVSSGHLRTELDEGPLLTLLGLPGEPGRLGRIDHYTLLEAIGHGSMGVVLRAFDEKLKRVVAVKVLSPVWAARPRARERFLREARAAAAIRDDHVVALYAVEESREIPYLVMEYIAGGSLQEQLDRGESSSIEEVVRIGREIALGLAAAHAHGLVHRDIKPANILLEERKRRVKITDFGLARAADDASLTQDGVVVGTPQFMAPEQARGEPIDQRADLFSLGCVLYSLGTGRAPFSKDGTLAILRSVSHDVPPAPREINPEIPEWLGRVITRLMAKNPGERIQSAAEVADLLSRQLVPRAQAAVETSEFRRVKPADSRTAKRYRFRPLAAAVVLLAAASLGLTESSGVTHFGATLIRVLTPDGVLAIAVDDPNVKVSVEGEGGVIITGIGPQEVRLRPGSYRWIATKEGKLLRTEVITISRGGRQLISIHLEPPSAAVGEIRRFEGHIKNVHTLAVSGDGARAISGSWDQTVRIWDLARGKELRCFNVRDETRRANHAIYCVALSSDRRLALAGSRDGTVWLWDVETGEERWRHTVPVARTMGATSVAFSPDGRHALVGSGDGVARLWQVSPWQEIQRLKHSQNEIWSVRFSPDGGQALTAGGDMGDNDGGLALWDLQTGVEIRRFKGHEQGLWCAVFSPDGRYVLSGSNDATLRLWDSGSAKELRCFKGHSRGVKSVAFSPDRRRALSAGMDQTIRLWDLDTGQELHRFVDRESGGEINDVAYVPPGGQALSGTFHGTIRLWQLPP